MRLLEDLRFLHANSKYKPTLSNITCFTDSITSGGNMDEVFGSFREKADIKSKGLHLIISNYWGGRDAVGGVCQMQVEFGNSYLDIYCLV